MQRARAFFFVAAGVLFLALAYAMGAQVVRAQVSPGSSWVALGTDGSGLFAMNVAGDVYHSGNGGDTWSYRGNPSIGSTPTARTSFGQVRARWDGR